jgi:hypothetical protein
VRSYSTGVTLRQLFYRLVSAEILPNTQSAYKSLSRYTAAARRVDGFPALIDRTRSIHRLQFVESPEEALDDLLDGYRRDRTEGQSHCIMLGVEKNAIVEQLWRWFRDRGLPIVALGGYASQSYVDDVARAVSSDGRSAVLIYAGDFDPSGEDIDRDFTERTNGCFDEVRRIALNPDQIATYNLPPQPGKTSDTRAGSFVARHGMLVQVELDALPPDILRGLYQDAIERLWDRSTYEAVLEREEREREALSDFRDQWEELR